MIEDIGFGWRSAFRTNSVSPSTQSTSPNTLTKSCMSLPFNFGAVLWVSKAAADLTAAASSTSGGSGSSPTCDEMGSFNDYAYRRFWHARSWNSMLW